MRLTGTYTLTAAVNPGQRRITGLIVPFGEEGNPGLGGEGIRMVVEAGGLAWDSEQDVRLRSAHSTQPIGRATTLDPSPAGIIANFKVANTTAGDDALTLAADGLQAGLSIEAEVPDGFTPDADGVWRLTADNPGRLTAVALVERPAFASAGVTEVAAAEVPDDTLTSAVDALRQVTDALAQSLPADQAGANQEGTSMSDTAQTAAEAVVPDTVTAEQARPIAPAAVTASTSVTREAFPYGHAGAEGVSLFQDIALAKTDSVRAQRAAKAQAMLAASSRGRITGTLLTGANEPIKKADVLVPNAYDPAHYDNGIEFPRVIADNVPGVAIDSPNPIVVPLFTSFLADGGSGEPVVASTEGSNPAQAELSVTSATVTPVWYTGLADVSRQAVDAGSPGIDALIMSKLRYSYRVTTEAAAVTAILANGTAGTDSVTNADTTDVEPKNMLYAIRKNMAAQYAALGLPTQAVLYASDVYQAAVGATNTTSGNPLYAFQDSRYQLVNQAGSAVAPAAGMLDVYGVPGMLAFALTATKVVCVNWSGVLRWESPLYEFNLDSQLPANYRFAVGGYFAQRTIQAKAVYYFAQA